MDLSKEWPYGQGEGKPRLVHPRDAAPPTAEPVTTSRWYELTDGSWAFCGVIDRGGSRGAYALSDALTRPPTPEEEESARDRSEASYQAEIRSGA